MEPKVIIDRSFVENELLAMRLDLEGLLGAIRYARHDWSLCTAFDPAGFAQSISYARCGRGLRELYVPKKMGWIAANWNNQCGISNPDLRIRVVPCNFNEYAGNRLVIPTNRSPKGEVTIQKTLCNRTAFFPGLFDDEPMNNSQVDDGFQNWVLGLYFDEVKPNGAELSLPVSMKGRYFENFASRIILLDSSDDSSIPEKDKYVGGEVEIVDISITKK